jgi:acetyltransferase-like isoleucine patch superfamily enzyme
MKKFHGEITNSIIAKNAIINDYSTIINSEISSHCSIGKFSFIAYSKLGKYSYASQNTIIKTTNIGNFTSISWGVSIGPEEHDYNKLTNHSFLCSTKMFNLSKNKFYNPFEKNCEIGNDVWIGCNSTILRGLKVGDGAIMEQIHLLIKMFHHMQLLLGLQQKSLNLDFLRKLSMS